MSSSQNAIRIPSRGPSGVISMKFGSASAMIGFHLTGNCCLPAGYLGRDGAVREDVVTDTRRHVAGLVAVRHTPADMVVKVLRRRRRQREVGVEPLVIRLHPRHDAHSPS